MAKKLATDRALFAACVTLLGLGLVMVWSASSATAQEQYGSAYALVIRQTIAAVVGLGLLFAALRIDYRSLNRPQVIYGAVLVATLMLIAVLFLPPVNDARRWVRVLGFSFQPSEFAKLSAILFLAYHVHRKSERINDLLTSIFPAGLLLAWFAFLVYLEPDLGTAATIVFVGGTILFLAGVRLRYFTAAGMIGLVWLARAVFEMSYRRERIGAFLNPDADALGSGYQILQSLIALGTGGLSGVGLMEGRQKLFYLPYPASDFIFAVIGEELGLIGTLALVLAFLFVLWRGFRAAWNAPDTFGRFLAGGLTLAIVLQALVNLSVVTGIVPTKGIPLPFISAGGSSLVLTLVAMGLVLNVSQHAD